MSLDGADWLLSLLVERPDGRLDPPDDWDVAFVEDPLPYDPANGSTLADVVTIDDFVAVALVNPVELPKQLRPTAAVAHYLPISPHRWRHINRIEVGCYTYRRFLEGTHQNRLIYLSVNPADRALRERIDRQCAWLERLLGEDVHRLDRFVGGPEFEIGFETAQAGPERHLELVKLPADR